MGLPDRRLQTVPALAALTQPRLGLPRRHATQLLRVLKSDRWIFSAVSVPLLQTTMPVTASCRCTLS
jgi:hypothetical protein